jgi:dTDP-4-dehydrorhamnose reductase|tara:strand:- start:1290 stop:2006 length:717 start_codon:yes stop_codon:yes gene_type:complete
MKRILVTGGAGRFATNIKKYSEELGYSVLAPDRKQMNVINFWDCEKYFYANQFDFDYVIHAAGLSSPMRRHEENPTESIQKNIIGTANVTLHCERFSKKIIYVSTNYVYPGIVGNYDEQSELKPFNNYGWSKLGGECAVHHYKDSLILRICMNARPFPHDKAFTDVISSHMFNDEAAKITLKLLDEVGIINIGGEAQSVYDFAVQEKPDVKKSSVDEVDDVTVNPNCSMNIDKMKSLI